MNVDELSSDLLLKEAEFIHCACYYRTAFTHLHQGYETAENTRNLDELLQYHSELTNLGAAYSRPVVTHSSLNSKMGNIVGLIADGKDRKVVPTFYPDLDDMLNGGLPEKTLTILAAEVHGGKTQALINMAHRQAQNGKNVLCVTLEMSEMDYMHRFISLISDIPLYELQDQDKSPSVQKRLSTFQSTWADNLSGQYGNIHIVDHDDGEFSAAQLQQHILRYGSDNIDIVYIDYLNLMNPSVPFRAADTYATAKKIAEELRLLAKKMSIPIVTATQVNRPGMNTKLEELDMNYVSESIGVPATADLMLFLAGRDDSGKKHEGEKRYKIVKNRMAPFTDSIELFYTDAHTLKMYDSSEMDIWLKDQELTRDLMSRETL
ncbi:DnaB-like helicase C-terminal domain-containing protein [Pseudodesulfovibrio sp. S3]|uniref:DnaB-like helicase C-terminal domain-containing protein n=1 Tax=Pseudodesulfovibrio sp. S3 TaxID=2283629 RepID=UPI0019D45DBF|nr:DnaB-like helicase C-terminal domain-containing protein [Pseudodesulfovibrio sp. S3]MCJ2163550.1 AAA family ATPase [Pseudodesulfovibrio sp. S3-i]